MNVVLNKAGQREFCLPWSSGGGSYWNNYDEKNFRKEAKQELLTSVGIPLSIATARGVSSSPLPDMPCVKSECANIM